MTTLEDLIRDELFETYNKCFKIWEQQTTPKHIPDFRNMMSELLEEVMEQRRTELINKLV